MFGHVHCWHLEASTTLYEQGVLPALYHSMSIALMACRHAMSLLTIFYKSKILLNHLNCLEWQFAFCSQLDIFETFTTVLGGVNFSLGAPNIIKNILYILIIKQLIFIINLVSWNLLSSLLAEVKSLCATCIHHQNIGAQPCVCALDLKHTFQTNWTLWTVFWSKLDH